MSFRKAKVSVAKAKPGTLVVSGRLTAAGRAGAGAQAAARTARTRTATRTTRTTLNVRIAGVKVRSHPCMLSSGRSADDPRPGDALPALLRRRPEPPPRAGGHRPGADGPA